MHASAGGAARRMETKKGLPKQSLYRVVLPGFEPGQAEPKTAVLPLHHKTILTTETHRPKSGAKLRIISRSHKISRKKSFRKIFSPLLQYKKI